MRRAAKGQVQGMMWNARKGGAQLPPWHLGSFSPCVSKTPRPDLSLTPLPKTFLSVAPGWDIGCFSQSPGGTAAVMFLAQHSTFSVATSHQLLHLTSLLPEAANTGATNIWGPALKEELWAHLFFFTFF